MALSAPRDFPENYWLPVVAAEADARLQLIKSLDGRYRDHNEVKAIAVKYACAVADVFAQQAGKAARASELPLAELDHTLDAFVDLLLHHEFFGIDHPRIKQNWSHRGGGNFAYEIKPLVMTQEWHRRYLASVPEILAELLKPEYAPTQLAERRRAFVQPRLTEKGLTVSSWSNLAGLDPSVAYDYLAGKSNPRAESRKALGEVLGVDPQDFP